MLARPPTPGSVNPTRFATLGFAAILLLLALLGWEIAQAAGEPRWPVVWSPLPPAQADAAAIEDVILRSYGAYVAAVETGDTAPFPRLFADRCGIALTREQARFLAATRAAHPELAAATQPCGLLSYERARVAAARAMRYPPSYIVRAGYHFLPSTDLHVRGGLAYLRYWYGPTLTECLLVRTPDGWKLAGQRVLASHAP